MSAINDPDCASVSTLRSAGIPNDLCSDLLRPRASALGHADTNTVLQKNGAEL